MNKQKLAEKIVKEMGGKENILQSWHCITRLRFNVISNDKVNIDKIRALDGVLGAQFKSGQFQVIIGNQVAEVFAAVSRLTGSDGSNHPSSSKRQKGNVIERIFDVISGIFTPILPAIVGAGLLKGLLALFIALQLLSNQSSTYEILHFISDAPFHFLPFLIAFSAAKKFNTDASLSVALAGILMYPKIMEYAAGTEVDSLSFLGLPIPMNSYASSVIPIILGVWLLSYIHKGADKIVPRSLRIIFVPLLTLVVTAPLTLLFIAPLGSYAGIYLDAFFSGLFDVAGPFAGLLMGGLMPLIVITGMHYAFFPGSFASFDKYGYDIMLLPMNFVANLAQAGATLGVLIKTKNKKMKQLSFSTFIPAMFGITEPAIYGVTMKLKKPFYASLVGGAVGGAIFGTLVVKTTAFTVPGIMSIPTYIMSGTNNLLYALIGVTASFTISLIMTLLLGFKDEENPLQAATHDTTPEKDITIDILSPITGKVMPLESVPDATFAEGLVGKGLAIEPKDGVVVAPFSGKVTTIAPTCHAIGITSNDGVELLIHIGLETVNLNGEGFTLNVQVDDDIKLGDKLLTFDIETIKKQDISIITPIIVTNSAHFLDVIATSKKRVTACDDKLVMLIK
ncbi:MULTISPECIES: beta-glucoside-specific PTS transporter subunit IIABC [Clostridia]|uniref:beta-glucoside-specific PTS transporter subunit IIABC n=1 Tax=Clostridia TaxID=186801 RepID=UPI000EA3267B|nr:MULTISPECIES: beta-glucoside-specific PTS transporter subunit IIABC [Clostridia]NBJ70316.1 PTS beta-glucoside transporter subunit EIIBCA [Roseburia sp. 1XD42-34]RKI76454.1 PTS beta-glucoside transporter subunit EIIBCA [Clostridium sp. 1xD42-85]